MKYNLSKDEKYEAMLCGLKVIELSNIDYLGQPTGSVMGSNILSNNYTFLLDAVIRGSITVDKAIEIRKAVREIQQKNHLIEDLEEDWPFTFTPKMYSDVRNQFIAKFEIDPDLSN